MPLSRVKVAEPYNSLIDELTADRSIDYGYAFKLKDTAAGQKLLNATPEEQRAFVLAAVEWINLNNVGDEFRWSYHKDPLKVRAAVMTLLRHRLPFSADDVIALLDWSLRQPITYWRAIPQMIKVVEEYRKDHEVTPELKERLNSLIDAVNSEYSNADTRQWVVSLRELTGQTLTCLPLYEGEAWSDMVIGDIGALDESGRAAWHELLNVCSKATGSAPSAKWLKSARPSIEKIGHGRFKQSLLKWFPLVDKPLTTRVESWSEREGDPNQMLDPSNADVLRALIWLCAEMEDADMARALNALAISAYRKVPGFGPRCVRLGNACVWALGRMPGNVGVGQLALLKVKIKAGSAQKGIESAQAEAARRAGMPQDEIEEISVPTYGLQEVGMRREQIGGYTAELVVTGTSSAELRWIKNDGKRQASVPQMVKEHHPEELKELTQAVKDVRKMLPALAERIDNLYLELRSWPFPSWRERYLDHPLVGTLTRRLIWKFTSDDRTASGVWHQGQIVGADSRPLDWLDDSTQVELWHPLHERTAAALRWREWFSEHELRQPFKQAHREVYVVTDAEFATSVYSNRFAAHVIRQHQFNALCAARRWKNKLRLMVDDEYPPASRLLPKLNLRAEFWVESVGDNYGTDTNETGTYLYLTTDQIRFYPLEAPQHYGHASGGGYHVLYGQGGVVAPLAMDQIPPLVFSEIMRDVDMFVGVASVANDPNWADGGPEGRYRDYWTSYSFGDLSETAKTRRQVLEHLVPRLKIAERCHLTDKFLVVRGDVRTYKIHLGSGNILMEPDDQYLCIVAARSAASDGSTGKVFLPFEGDNTLAIILSKAFLLAEDWNIKDPTILRQIGR